MVRNVLVVIITVFTRLFPISEGTASNLLCVNDSDATVENNLPFCVIQGYDKSVFKDDKNDESEPLNVNIAVVIEEVMEIKDHEKTVKLEAVLSLSWIDSRLQLNENSPKWEGGDGYKWTHLPLEWLDWIWKPDIHISNIKGLNVGGIFKSQSWAELYGDKRIWYEIPVEITLTCPLFAYHYYPFDVQTCDLWIGSFWFTADQCKYKGKVFYNKTSQRTLEYAITDIQALSYEDGIMDWKGYYITRDGEIDDYGQKYSNFVIRMTFTRQINSYLLTVFLPLAILVIGSWIGFLIDPAIVEVRMANPVVLLLASVTMR